MQVQNNFLKNVFLFFPAIPPFLMNHLEKKAFLKVGIYLTHPLSRLLCCSDLDNIGFIIID